MYHCLSTRPVDTAIIAPVSVRLIPNSSSLFQYQTYWNDLVHQCPSSCPTNTMQLITILVPSIDTTVHHSPKYLYYWYYWPSSRPTDMTQFTSAPVPTILIRYSTLLPKYQAYWYDTVHFCPSTNPTDTIQSAIALARVLLYATIHFCPSTSPTDTLQSYIVPIPVLLIPCRPLLSLYQHFLYDTVHHCPVPVLHCKVLIRYNPLLPYFQSYW